MPHSDEQPLAPQDFRGVVRLFPVPNLVLFPHVMQPLHIFEPRYRSLTEDALAGDSLVATAIFEPGWEADYEDAPALKPFACLGKIVTHHRMDDGRFNVLLVGLLRIEIAEELPRRQGFREAKAVLTEDIYTANMEPQRQQLKRRLIDALQSMLTGYDDAREHLEPLLSGELGLGPLTDIAAYTLNMPPTDKQWLLAERNVDRRAEKLVAWMTAQGAGSGKSLVNRFPPDFSAN